LGFIYNYNAITLELPHKQTNIRTKKNGAEEIK